MPVTLTDADVVLEAEKPVAIVTTLLLFGQPVKAALTLSGDSVNGYIELQPTTLAQLIPTIANVPSLAVGEVNQARLDIKNIWNKTVQGQTAPPLQATLRGGTSIFPTRRL